MNWRKGATALFGGALGFSILMLANTVALETAFQALSFFSGASLTPGQTLLIYCFSPALTIAGAGLTARSLGATGWHSLLTGIAALTTATAILLASRNNVAPFYQVDALALIGAAAMTVCLSMLGKAGIDTTALAVMLGLGLLLVLAISLLARYGFFIALAAWLLLPAAAGLFRRPE
jgi:hypothetical protein